jgi:hypothetical protein
MVERSSSTVLEPREISMSQDFSMCWLNAWEARGFCSGREDLADLISKIGSSEPWAFLVFTRKTSSRFAQCCGDAPDGLAVEVGDGHGEPRLVVPRGAVDLPEELTACGKWSYWASPTELHTVPSAIEIIGSWLDLSSIASGFELHKVHLGGGWIDLSMRL